jgi:hypothetical protein
MVAAPTFQFDRPEDTNLDDLVRGYVHITGDPVTRAPKRNLIAAGYRVHGENFFPLVLRLFTTMGTATNLLGIIRCLSPIEAVRLLGAAAADGLGDEQAAGASGRSERPCRVAPGSAVLDRSAARRRPGLGFS